MSMEAIEPLEETHVVAAELGAGIVALEGVQGSSKTILALRKWKLGELGTCSRIQDTHALLPVPLLVLVGHDPLMHDAGIVELGGPFRVLGNLLAIDGGRKGEDCCSVLHGGYQVSG